MTLFGAICWLRIKMANFGIVIDIDGVILRGDEIIPGAIDAVKKVGHS